MQIEVCQSLTTGLWYIVYDNRYLHKDNTWHKATCTDPDQEANTKNADWINWPGYYKTQEEAQQTLDKYNALHQN